MEPDTKRPEMDDEMPPIDDELREAMENMAHRQKQCLRLQRLLVLLEVACFWNAVGVWFLFANVIVCVFWGNWLSNKGWKLVIRAYPWFHNIPFLCGPSGGKGYNGITAGRRIRAEAKKTGDTLTVKLLDFDRQSMLWPFLGALGYFSPLMLYSRFVR